MGLLRCVPAATAVLCESCLEREDTGGFFVTILEKVAEFKPSCKDAVVHTFAASKTTQRKLQNSTPTNVTIHM
eukprot:4042921-Amphidinium_carterae.1